MSNPRIRSILFMTTALGVPCVFAWSADEGKDLPNEAAVGGAYKKAYHALIKEKPTPETLKKIVNENVAPALKDQEDAIKKKAPPSSDRAKKDVAPAKPQKNTDAPGAVRTGASTVSSGPVPTVDESAPEIDPNLIPGMIIYEKGKEPVEFPQDRSALPGEIQFSGSAQKSKQKKDAFDP